MYDNNHSYIITSFAAEEVQQKVRKLRKSLGIAPYQGGDDADDIITKNHAHVTIKGSFSLKEGFTEAKLLEKLSALSFPQIAIQADSYEVFESQDLGTIPVLLISQTEELKKLHMKVISLLEEYIYSKNPTFERDNYTPHVSIVYELDSRLKDEALQLIQDLLPLSYTVDNILLLRSKPEARHTRKLVKKFQAKGSDL